MNLTIDIGNSYTHLGVFAGRKLVYASMVLTPHLKDAEKELIKLKHKFRIERVGFSSVVTEAELVMKKTVKKIFKITPFFISGKVRLPVKLKVKNKANLGADRICNAAAGFEYFKRKENVIIIDLGTATTYDVVLKNGEFIGGAISPGVETSAEALNINTSKLPLLTLKKLNFPGTPIGKNTLEALKSGIMFSALDSMEAMIRRIEKSLNRKFKIILTGGFAKKIKRKITRNVTVKQHLVNEGINLILGYNEY